MERKYPFKTVAACLTVASTLLLSACHDVYDSTYVKELKSQLPDFSMRSVVETSIDYGKSAAGAMVTLYTEDPILKQYDEQGHYLFDKVNEELEPTLSTFLDENGRFVGNFSVPTSEKEVWLVSDDWGAPRLVTATIENNVLRVSTNTGSTRAQMPRRRVVADNRLTSSTYARNTATFGTLTDIMGGWDMYGKPNDVNELMSKGEYTTANLITPVQYTFWHGYTSKGTAYQKGALNNGDMVSATNEVNTTIATSYVGKDGLTHTIQDCEIYFTFLSERAGYASTMGYYFYKNTDAATVRARDVEKFIIVPNASIADDGVSNDGMTYVSSNAPMAKNDKIQLLFRDPATGKLTSKFPAGYTIGYFMISDASRKGSAGTSTWDSGTTRLVNGTESQYRLSSKMGYFGYSVTYYYVNEKSQQVQVSRFYNADGSRSSSVYGRNGCTYYYRTIYTMETSQGKGATLNTNNQWIYSNAEWNTASHFPNKRKEQFVALTNSANGDVVYGVEDGGDQSYEDVLFTITATPNEAIFNPDRPTINKEGEWKKTSAQNAKHGYYAFEDIWSSGGDYDMNDVIVEYTISDSISQVTKYTTTIDARTGAVIDTKSSTRSFLDKLVINIKPRHAGAMYKDGFSIQLPEYITSLYDAGKIKSIRVNNEADIKDNPTYWKRLSSANTDLNGAVVNANGFLKRFTYEFFNDIRQQNESSNYKMVIQFDTSERNAVSPSAWNVLSHPAGATKNDYMLRWDYNPFITVYNLSGNLNTSGSVDLEIHMPLYPFTETGIPVAGGASGKTAETRDWNLWFVSAENAGSTGSVAGATMFYPFAIDIPYTPEYRPSKEMTKISVSYPGFRGWQLENTAEDWYRHPATDKVQPFTLDFSQAIYDNK